MLLFSAGLPWSDGTLVTGIKGIVCPVSIRECTNASGDRSWASATPLQVSRGTTNPVLNDIVEYLCFFQSTLQFKTEPGLAIYSYCQRS
jgi:hypothetical protein